jgi:hypothetical protein
MGRIWVLDTETKGTGAEMVPLEKALTRRAPKAERLSIVRRKPKSRPNEQAEPSAAPEPRQPRRFKVVNILTRQVLAEGADARATVDSLREVRSVVDVQIDVWEPAVQKWRPLTFGEQKAIWAFRDRDRGAIPTVF